MALHVTLNETQIKITGENNQKLAEIIEHDSLKKLKVDKKNFLNNIIETASESELLSLYKRSLGFESRAND